MKAAAVIIALWTAQAQTITNCGGADDILSNAVITMTPDPPQPGQPFTLEVSGTTTKQMAKGHIGVDLTIKVLGGIVKIPIQTGSSFEVAPGYPATDVSFKFGPLTVPSLPAALGKIGVKGQVDVSDDAGARITCVGIDGSFGVSSKEEQEEVPPAAVGLAGWSFCGQDSDHLKNPTITQNNPGITFTGTLDEDVASGAAVVDMTIGIVGISVPVQLEVPFALSPAVPTGDLMIKLTPDSVTPIDLPVTVLGSVKVNDGNGEEIACVGADSILEEVQV